MHLVLRSLLLIASCAFSEIAAAESWLPWPDQLYVSPKAHFYVVMKRTGGPTVSGEWGPVEYLICERAEGAKPIEPVQSRIVELRGRYDARNQQLYQIDPHPNVRERHGDRILGRGTLQRPPALVVISDSGLGFAGLGVYGDNFGWSKRGLRARNAVIVVGSDGKVMHRKRIVDLLSARQIEGADLAGVSLSWLDGGWVDEKTGKLQIVVDYEPTYDWNVGRTQSHRSQIWSLDWRSGELEEGPKFASLEAVEEFRKKSLGGDER